MAKGQILVVDDNPNLLELIRLRLESADYEVTAIADEADAINAIKEKLFDLCIVDLMLANGDGIALMDQFRGINPDVPTIILTAHGSIESAVEAMRRGAFSYLTKPFEPSELLMQIERALENRKLNVEIKRLKEIINDRFDFANIIALPLLLGVGVAFKIYYIMAWREGQTNLLQTSLTRAVFFSALTTATAFGSLWFSSHPGTASMGKLLALSLMCTLAAAVLFQPVLMGKPRDD